MVQSMKHEHNNLIYFIDVRVGAFQLLAESVCNMLGVCSLWCFDASSGREVHAHRRLKGLLLHALVKGHGDLSLALQGKLCCKLRHALCLVSALLCRDVHVCLPGAGDLQLPAQI